MNISPLLATANGGEWSPLMYGRVDLAKYQNSARRLVNMIPLAQGPATHRPGTRHMAPTRSNCYARLLPFIFSTTQAYVIEATASRFRFYRNRAQIVVSGVAAWVTSHTYAVADLVVQGGVNYYCATAHTSGTFATDLGVGKWVALTGSVYEVTTPYTEADLDQLKWCQSNDVLYLWHPKYAPRKLSRLGHTAWTVTIYEPEDGPYLDENTTETTLTASATSGSITITASSTTGINAGDGFLSTDVGRLVRIKGGSPSKWGWAKITAVGSTTSVTAQVKSDLGTTSAVKTWRLGAWSETTGWPVCGTIFQDRVWAAGTRTRPNTVWASEPGDFENMAPSDTDGTVAADHGITATMSDDQLNTIVWMSAGKSLAVGTQGGEYLIRSASSGEAITPDNVNTELSTTKGCADAMPVQVDAAVLFIQASGRKLHEFAYNFESDGYRSPDLTRLAGHVTRAKIKAIAIQKEPWGIIWGIRQDGLLVALTYLREEDVIAWSRHPVGGCFNGGQAVVESIASIPGDGQDELWLSVKRTINGQTVRHVESMEYEFWPETNNDLKEAVFMDAAATYRGAAATHISGLDHLEGQEVFVLADGSWSNATVAGGAIDLAFPASIVHVGLYAQAEYETMNLEYGTGNGTSVGKVKRVTEATVRFWASLGASVGPVEGDLEEIDVADGPITFDTLPGLFTGEKSVTFPANWERQARVLIVQPRPLPLTVAGIAPTLTTQS